MTRRKLLSRYTLGLLTLSAAALASTSGGASAATEGVCSTPTLTPAAAQQQAVEYLTSLEAKGWKLTDTGNSVVSGKSVTSLAPAHAIGGRGGFMTLAVNGKTTSLAKPKSALTRTPQSAARLTGDATAWLFCNFDQPGYGYFWVGAGTYTAKSFEERLDGTTRFVTLGTQACSVVEAPCLTYAYRDPPWNWSVTSIIVSGTGSVTLFQKGCIY